ncbi:MFS transporter [Ensifer soli]|uniref:MFS transporter n=1 Tax=Ciceribacter sp. sgz301302 TaxID=3342379 RepID=UPI0035B9AF33
MNASSALPPAGGAPRHFAGRIALLFCAPLILNGFAMPYFPVWLRSLSLSDVEIGIVLSTALFIRVLTAPVAGLIADRIGERANVLVWTAALALVSAVLLLFTGSFLPVLIVYTLQSAFFAPYVPIVEAIALTGVRRWRFDYGRMRFGGSIAFIAANMVGGVLIGIVGGAMVVPAIVVGTVLMLAMALFAPRVGRPRRPSPVATLTQAPPRALRKLDLQLLMVGVTMINGSHAMLFAFSAIHWQAIGFGGTEIGLLWSAGVASEVVMFLCARRMLRRFSLWSMMATGSCLAALRWILFPLDPGFAGFFVLQCFHAFTFAIMHAAMQNKLVQQVPEEQEGAAQGLYFFYNGGFLALFTLLSGVLYERFGVEGFYGMSLIVCIGAGFVLCARLVERRDRAMAMA